MEKSEIKKGYCILVDCRFYVVVDIIGDSYCCVDSGCDNRYFWKGEDFKIFFSYNQMSMLMRSIKDVVIGEQDDRFSDKKRGLNDHN